MGQFINTVTMRLKYQDGEIVLPLNPESIKVVRESRSLTEEILGIGEVSIPQTHSLAEISIESAFYRYLIEQNPAAHQFRTTKEYADWFKTWQLSKLPAHFTVEELGFHRWVVCETFDYEVRSGEEDDVYYELQLREFRPYGAKIVEVSEDTAAPSGDARADTSPPVTQSYTVVWGDSLWAIAQRLSGSGANWRELYEENKATLGNDPNVLYPGQVLSTPAAWVT